jgi:catechol 2,3-dioxygenase-like lactoylglutathione lyase family enzyme
MNGIRIFRLPCVAGALLACAAGACRPGAGPGSASAAPSPARPAITRIAAVRVFVTDVAKSRAFYGSVLGLPASTSAAFAVNHRQRVELVPIPAPGPSLIAGIVLSTNDATGMHRYLVDRGVAPGPVLTDAAGARRFDVADPEGHPLTFEESDAPSVDSAPAAPEQVSARLLHAGFIVRDPATLDRFYRDLLGFRMYWHGGMTETSVDWVEVQVPDGDDWLEYMLNVPLDAGHDDRGVMNHFALGVATLGPAVARLRAHGYRTDDEPEIGRDGKWQFDIFDPDATRVEFMEFLPARAPCCHPYESAHPGGS